MQTNLSALKKAKELFPGGVNSPVRAFLAVGGNPPFIKCGRGAYITDIENKSYIDYVGSWGPLILGHAFPEVVKEVAKAAEEGLTFGAPTLREIELAELIRKAFPSMELMRFVSSGTEACMSAIRLARGYTGRKLIVKFDGCYHGHGDSLLVSAGSGMATLGIPACPGITEETASGTLVAPFNDLEAVKEIFRKHPKQIAGVILEPVCGNIGVVLPKEGFLSGLAEITRNEGALLIFDEVMTGFRGCFGGAQTLWKITPDLTCLGKIVGGGLPLAVYGGREAIMRKIAPDGQVYQAGTLSGNPVAVAAGTATLYYLSKNLEKYQQLDTLVTRLCDGLSHIAKKYNEKVQINRWGSMFTVFFTGTSVVDYQTAKTCDTRKFASWFQKMLAEGVYLPPSQFEAAFVSMCHTEKEIEATLEAADKAFKGGIS